jgi:hypothetical protein
MQWGSRARRRRRRAFRAGTRGAGHSLPRARSARRDRCTKPVSTEGDPHRPQQGGNTFVPRAVPRAVQRAFSPPSAEYQRRSLLRSPYSPAGPLVRTSGYLEGSRVNARRTGRAAARPVLLRSGVASFRGAEARVADSRSAPLQIRWNGESADPWRLLRGLRRVRSTVPRTERTSRSLTADSCIVLADD